MMKEEPGPDFENGKALHLPPYSTDLLGFFWDRFTLAAY